MTLSSIPAFLAVEVMESSNASHSDLTELDLQCLAPVHSKQILPSFLHVLPHAVISSQVDLSGNDYCWALLLGPIFSFSYVVLNIFIHLPNSLKLITGS